MDDKCCDQCERNRTTLKTLISWMAQTAGSPISRDNAIFLMDMLDKKAPPHD